MPTWTRRHPAHLVKLLALQPHHRLHREQVLDLLWPDDPLDVAVPKLHKAAHFARKQTGEPSAVVLRGDVVALFPDAEVDRRRRGLRASAPTTRARRRRHRAGGRACWRATTAICSRTTRTRSGWPRPASTSDGCASSCCGCSSRWDDVLRLEPGDEEAHVALMARFADAGDRYQALRQYDRLDRTLRAELGVRPGRDAPTPSVTSCSPPRRSAPPVAPVLVGRGAELATPSTWRWTAWPPGTPAVVVLTGPAGSGKSALLRAAVERAAERGWRLGSGTVRRRRRRVGVRPGARRGHRPVPSPPDAARRRRRRLPHRDRPRARPGSTRRGTATAPTSGCSSPSPSCSACAGATTGAVLAIDDVHDADDATIRLLHHLARALTDSPGPAPVDPPPAVGRRAGRSLPLGRAARARPRRRRRSPTTRPAPLAAANIAPGADERLDDIVGVAAGNPYLLLQLARHAASGPTWMASIDAAAVAGIPGDTRELLQRVASTGSAFDSDEFVALTGLPDAEAFEHLDRAIALGVLEPADDRLPVPPPPGPRGAAARRPAAPAAADPPRRRRAPRRRSAPRRPASPTTSSSPTTSAAPSPTSWRRPRPRRRSAPTATPWRWSTPPVPARPGPTAPGWPRCAPTCFMALGDPAAVSAFREALELAEPDDRRRLRARLARAAVMSGDIETANAALDGLALDGGADDGEILLAQGYTAFFSADFDGAVAVADEARRRVLGGDQTWQVLDLVSLEGLIAHQRGEWFDRMRGELRRTRDVPAVANALFDGYLCPAEYLLYGPTPYADVIATARGLRDTALRSGALRAVAFATALIGEAAVLSGDLELAAGELQEAVELHHDLGAGAGEAHCLQRLAEVHLARGRRRRRPGGCSTGPCRSPAGRCWPATCCSGSTAR